MECECFVTSQPCCLLSMNPPEASSHVQPWLQSPTETWTRGVHVRRIGRYEVNKVRIVLCKELSDGSLINRKKGAALFFRSLQTVRICHFKHVGTC